LYDVALVLSEKRTEWLRIGHLQEAFILKEVIDLLEAKAQTIKVDPTSWKG